MAKKQSESTHHAAPPDKGEPAGRLKGSWREAAIKELGDTASDVAIAERMSAYAKEAGYGWMATAEWVGKKRADKNGTPRQPRATASATGPLTFAQVLSVRAAVKDGDLDEATVDRVVELAAKVGGIDRLKEALAAIRSWGE